MFCSIWVVVVPVPVAVEDAEVSDCLGTRCCCTSGGDGVKERLFRHRGRGTVVQEVDVVSCAPSQKAGEPTWGECWIVVKGKLFTSQGGYGSLGCG